MAFVNPASAIDATAAFKTSINRVKSANAAVLNRDAQIENLGVTRLRETLTEALQTHLDELAIRIEGEDRVADSEYTFEWLGEGQSLHRNGDEFTADQFEGRRVGTVNQLLGRAYGEVTNAKGDDA